MVENFLNLKKTDNRIQKAQKKVPKQYEPNGPKPRCITIKMAKVREFLKVSRERQSYTRKSQ